MKNNVKKLVSSIALGLLVTAGIGATISTAASQSNLSEEPVVEMELYDIDYDKTANMNSIEFTQYLIDNGFIDKQEGLLELAYYKATTDEEKQAKYIDLINYQVSKGEISESEGNQLKKYRHDEDLPGEIKIEIQFDQM